MNKLQLWSVMASLQNYVDADAGNIDLMVHTYVIARTEEQAKEVTKQLVLKKYKATPKYLEASRKGDSTIWRETFTLRGAA